MQVWEFFYEPGVHGRSPDWRAQVAVTATSSGSSLAPCRPAFRSFSYSSRAAPLCIVGLIWARWSAHTPDPATSAAGGLPH